MEKFKASSDRVEVNGETIISFVGDSIQRVSILEKHGIFNVRPGVWYKQQLWLNAFKEISDKIGPITLRLIGKAIPANAKFPPEIKTTKPAFELLDTAYKMNHRGGEIGYYKFVSYDENSKQIQMEINTPYPEEFDEGILVGLLEKFKPMNYKTTPKVVKRPIKIGVILYTLSW